MIIPWCGVIRRGKLGFSKPPTALTSSRGKIYPLPCIPSSSRSASRAKHDKYIIGNADNSSSVPMWRDVCQMFRDANTVGNQLGLVFPRRQETPIQISEPEDFLCPPSEEAVISNAINGSTAVAIVALVSVMHKVVACAQPCDLLHPANIHARGFAAISGQCTTPVDNILLPCGHILTEIDCWRTPLSVATSLCRGSSRGSAMPWGKNVGLMCQVLTIDA